MSNAAVAAIQYALECGHEGMGFLRLWNEGEFKTLRDEWDDIPEEVFIGADPLHPETVIEDDEPIIRWFIFFYKCNHGKQSKPGMYGWSSALLPSADLISENISKGTTDADFTPGQISFTSISEVSELDYKSFFDKDES